MYNAREVFIERTGFLLVLTSPPLANIFESSVDFPTFDRPAKRDTSKDQPWTRIRVDTLPVNKTWTLDYWALGKQSL